MGSPEFGFEISREDFDKLDNNDKFLLMQNLFEKMNCFSRAMLAIVAATSDLPFELDFKD